jgi:hypothetical protein
MVDRCSGVSCLEDECESVDMIIDDEGMLSCFEKKCDGLLVNVGIISDPTSWLEDKVVVDIYECSDCGSVVSEERQIGPDGNIIPRFESGNVSFFSLSGMPENVSFMDCASYFNPGSLSYS